MTCDDARGLIARRADESGEYGSDTALDRHVLGCADCRAALEEQREVVAVLRSRPVMAVSPTFAERLTARLDEASGWFGIADWRTWTIRVAPIAAALMASRDRIASVIFMGLPLVAASQSSGADTTFQLSPRTRMISTSG